MNDSKRSLTHGALLFFSGTFLSRITGLCRDMVMAYYFGTSAVIAAFLVAFRFSNLLRRLFGEGSLMMGFVPTYESLRAESAEKSTQFFRDLFYSITIILLLVISAIETVLYSLSFYTSSSILDMTMIMLPGLLFICYYGLLSGILQSHGRYFLSALAPACFNLVWILAMVWIHKEETSLAVYHLSFAILAGFMVQCALLVPSTLKVIEPIQWLKGRLLSPEVRKMLGMISLTVIGVGAVQFNSAIDAIFARYASLEGPAFLTYAIRIYQLPLSLFAIAASSALLPPLSRAIERGDMVKYKELLIHAVKITSLCMIPCMLGFYLVGDGVVGLIFGRGEFGSVAVLNTTHCLWAYGIGLLPASVVVLLASGFYAQKDFKTPTLSSVVSVGVNVVLNGMLIFIFDFGAISVAVATSISAYCNLIFLVIAMRKAWFKQDIRVLMQ